MNTITEQNPLPPAPADAPFRNPSLPIAERVRDLIGRMTLEEKVSQTVNAAIGIERLGLAPYDWWNECLHGVGRAGIATVFPQAIGLSATWNTPLVERMAAATSDEARAKYHDANARAYHKRYFGLTFWSPNINIFRDPRWGRGQETYGEDPFLTARLGVAFVKGLQGDDPRYLKTAACAKHYAVHSGPEHTRHHFDARVNARDLHETYLYAFKALVQEAKVEAIMGAYNRVNGEACNASPTLLQKILREQWGFQGHVVSDCGAVEDIYEHHQLFRIKEEAIAAAVRAGCDLCCGAAYAGLTEAVRKDFLTEAALDVALTHLFTSRFKLGMFDPDALVPFAKIPYSVVDSAAHRELARQAARESLVLLKNDGLLPLRDGQFNTIAVIGPNAHNAEVQWGNYNGTPSYTITPLDGLVRRAFPGSNVFYTNGCPLNGGPNDIVWETHEHCEYADLIVAVVGLSAMLEGEEGAGGGTGDRTGLGLPASQQAMLEIIQQSGKPFIVVLLNGSMVELGWAHEHANAIIEAWYPGQEGGTAIAEVIFGDYNPGGRLPVTFYQSTEQLPPFEDYSMTERTYRFFTGEPLYPFGYGLSYTTFQYDNLRASATIKDASAPLTVTVDVTNTGDRAGDEVAQLYLNALAPAVPAPLRQLRGFQRVHLDVGETRTLTFTLAPDAFALTADDGASLILPGAYRLAVGGKQPDQAQRSDRESNVLTIEVCLQ